MKDCSYVVFQGGLALSEDSHPNLDNPVLQVYSKVNIAPSRGANSSMGDYA
jgi:hypothetical protein